MSTPAVTGSGDARDDIVPSADLLAEAATRVAASYPELFRHQTAGVAFLLSRRRAILADDMGLGKTRTAIVAARASARSTALASAPSDKARTRIAKVAVIKSAIGK